MGAFHGASHLTAPAVGFCSCSGKSQSPGEGDGGLACGCSFVRAFPSQLGKQKKKYMPYNYQHKYFFLSEYPPPAPGGLLPWQGLPTGV